MSEHRPSKGALRPGGVALAVAAVVIALVAALVARSADAATPGGAGQCGSASWYALTSRTASGERMNPDALTAAHRKLRFGTRVRVTNRRNGRSVVLRINDRGPFIKGRIIDVSRAAAAKLGFRGRGHAPVVVSPVSRRWTGRGCATRSAYVPAGRIASPTFRPATVVGALGR